LNQVRVIDLSKNKLGDEGVAEVGRALAETAWVEQLSLADNQVCPGGKGQRMGLGDTGVPRS